MKIHIIGCSGSGKTYLAKKLSQKYNISSFDLDDIQWDNTHNGYGIKNSIEKRASMLSKALENNNWIIEGVYYSWVEQCFSDADVIYVLDMPEYLYKWRILKRSAKRILGIEKGKKETFKSIINLLKWTKTFQNVNMKEIRVILEKHKAKVVWISTRKDVRKLLKQQPISMTDKVSV